MAATLANRGVNPLTGVQVITPHIVARTLSVMTSSGMYDYAGEWIYRVGIPAKSGVGGGIVAALPSHVSVTVTIAFLYVFFAETMSAPLPQKDERRA